MATDEIRFGDNDRLAALVAHVVQAEALVLLSDVDGLYDGPPSRAGATLITDVHGPDDLRGVRVKGTGGAGVGLGGMTTKVEAASIATSPPPRVTPTNWSDRGSGPPLVGARSAVPDGNHWRGIHGSPASLFVQRTVSWKKWVA